MSLKFLQKYSYAAGTAARKIRHGLGLPINQKLIRFCGIQRSGNHALINWIIAQEALPTCFINGAFPGMNPWEDNNWGISYPHYPYWPASRDRQGALVKKELMIYSYENRSLIDIENDKSHLPTYIGKSQEDYLVMVLRDPYNTFASWLQRDTPVNEEIISLWKSYAYEFIGRTDTLSAPKVFVNFNAWFSEPDYRKYLAHKLGLTFTDRGLKEVSHHGGGSSFDGRSLKGNATSMNVLNRFEDFLDNQEFRMLFEKDDELKQLSHEVFDALKHPFTHP